MIVINKNTIKFYFKFHCYIRHPSNGYKSEINDHSLTNYLHNHDYDTLKMTMIT